MPAVPTMVLDGERLKWAFAARGVTSTEVAAKSGLSASSLDRCLAGHPISRMAARAIARALGSTLEKLKAN